MKKLLFILTALLGLSLQAQQMRYVDADRFPLIGKGVADAVTSSRYQRLPDSLQTLVPRPFLWELGQNTAGLALRFASDSPRIGLRWTNTAKVEMNHMTPTGIRGFDLYVLQPDSSWRFVDSARPKLDSIASEAVIISGSQPEGLRDYMLFFPLYDGVSALEIGVDTDCQLTAPIAALPQTGNPIVAYGTSIMQGCSASRPGIAITNRLMSVLNRETVNLGFSGNGQLDLEIAPVVAAVPNPAFFLLDFCPNVNRQLIEEKMIPFFDIIRAANPDTPVLFVENAPFPNVAFDAAMDTEVAERNAALRREYQKLLDRGETNIYYLPGDNLIGLDGEATVDCIHYTDLGFWRYLEILTPLIQSILE